APRSATGAVALRVSCCRGMRRSARCWIAIALSLGCGQMVQAPDTAVAAPPGRGSTAAERPATPPRGAAPAPRAPSSEPDQLVDAHNRARARHCAKPLTWSPRLAQVAQHWANALRDKGCVFGHSGGDYGENLAAGTAGTLDPEAVVKMWYDEVAQYRFASGGF